LKRVAKTPVERSSGAGVLTAFPLTFVLTKTVKENRLFAQMPKWWNLVDTLS